MFAVTVTFDIVPGQMPAFLPLMIANAQASRDTEPGCHVFDICHDDDRVFLYELYTDRAAFDAHLTTPHFKTFDAETAQMIAGKTIATFAKVIR